MYMYMYMYVCIYICMYIDCNLCITEVYKKSRSCDLERNQRMWNCSYLVLLSYSQNMLCNISGKQNSQNKSGQLLV